MKYSQAVIWPPLLWQGWLEKTFLDIKIMIWHEALEALFFKKKQATELQFKKTQSDLNWPAYLRNGRSPIEAIKASINKELLKASSKGELKQ